MKKKLVKKVDAGNLIKLMQALKEADEKQKNMTEQEKKDNAIKMHTDKGDIYY